MLVFVLFLLPVSFCISVSKHTKGKKKKIRFLFYFKQTIQNMREYESALEQRDPLTLSRAASRRWVVEEATSALPRRWLIKKSLHAHNAFFFFFFNQTTDRQYINKTIVSHTPMSLSVSEGKGGYK